MTDQHSALRSSSRGYLDLSATVLMIAASISVLLLTAWTWLNSPVTATAEENREPPLPPNPVSIAGASLTGSGAAQAVLIQFFDFQCPFCAKFARETWPTLRKTYVDSGKVQLAIRHLPLEAIHPLAFRAAEAPSARLNKAGFGSYTMRSSRNP
jgi:Thioredoxin